jgi:hypothetical protein
MNSNYRTAATVFLRGMVCFWNMSVNTLHKGDKCIDDDDDDDDDDDNNNNNKGNNNNNNSILILLCLIKSELIIKSHKINETKSQEDTHPPTHIHTQKEPNITNSKKVEIYN